MTNIQDDFFGFLFEYSDQSIDRLGNQLLELDANIDWEAFYPLLDRVRMKARKSPAGCKP
jgi:IS5 family transposase